MRLALPLEWHDRDFKAALYVNSYIVAAAWLNNHKQWYLEVYTIGHHLLGEEQADALEEQRWQTLGELQSALHEALGVVEVPS